MANPRVAVLLCGQPREAMLTAPIIKRFIINPNNADVFMHMWYDDGDLHMDKGDIDRGNTKAELGIDKQLIEFYQPKSYLVEQDNLKQFKNFNNNYFKLPEKYLENYMKMNPTLSREDCINHTVKVLVSQVYSVYKCNSLKEEYAYTNNIQYDYVIKMRYDTTPMVEIKCPEFDPNVLYYQFMNQPDNIISDWFNMGSSSIMNIYASIFLNLKYLNDTVCDSSYPHNERPQTDNWDIKQGCWSYEYLLRDLMAKYKIKTVAINAGFKLMPKS